MPTQSLSWTLTDGQGDEPLGAPTAETERAWDALLAVLKANAEDAAARAAAGDAPEAPVSDEEEDDFERACKRRCRGAVDPVRGRWACLRSASAPTAAC